MFAIYKKELKSYFINMTGYIFMAVLLFFVGLFVTMANLWGGMPSITYALSNMTLVFLFIIPILTMRSFAEERHAKTDQLLYALPIRVSGIVLGKYFAMLTVLLLPMLIISLYPIILSFFGEVSVMVEFGVIFAFFLMTSALIAICMFVSTLTDSQIIAAVISLGVLLLTYLLSIVAMLISTTAIASFIGLLVIAALAALIVFFMTKNSIVSLIVAAVFVVPISVAYMLDSSLFAGLLPELLKTLSLFNRFSNFNFGIFDVKAIVYYLSVIVFFVFLSVQAVEKRRWS